MSSPRRLFFALTLPNHLQQQMIHWRAEVFPPEAGRPVAASKTQYHQLEHWSFNSQDHI